MVPFTQSRAGPPPTPGRGTAIAPTQRLLLADFALRWLETGRQRWTPTTANDTRRILRRHIIPAMGDLEVHAVTAHDVEAYKASRLTPRDRSRPALAPKTVNNHLAVLRALFADAVRWGHAVQDPTGGMPSCRVDPTGLQLWDEAEARAFLLAIAAGRPRWLPLYTTALHTGMRLGELAALRWSAVHFRTRCLDVLETMTRARRARLRAPRRRRLPMSHAVQGLLEPLRGDAASRDPVFLCDQGRTLTSDRIKASMRYGIQEGGVPAIGFDDLRHTFAGVLSARGIDRVQLGELLGHGRARDTARYDHLRAQRLDAAAALDAAYGAQG